MAYNTKELDQKILDAILKFDGVPSAKALGRELGMGTNTIIKRINENPDLWLAYYTKQGLTPDQAVELALERKQTEASKQALTRRLRHLHAYREMAGIIRCFGELLTKTVTEVSLYPEPLAKAAEELNTTINVTHVGLDNFRKKVETEVPAAATVVVQSVHRLATEALTSLFKEIRKNSKELM